MCKTLILHHLGQGQNLTSSLMGCCTIILAYLSVTDENINSPDLQQEPSLSPILSFLSYIL